MAYDDSNIFARILRKEIPAHVVEEDDSTLTFMDIMPQSDGHSLVIPKVPAVNLFDISKEDLTSLIAQTQRVAKAAMTAFDCEGVMVLQLNNAGAGQSVFHIHFHVIPRSGGLPRSIHGRGQAPDDELSANAAKLRAALQDIPR